MKTSKHILFSCLFICLVTMQGFSQVSKSTDQKDKSKAESSKTAGLRKIASGSGLQNLDIDIQIDEEAMETSIEEAMELLETSLANLEIEIEPIEINLSELNIEIEPIVINIPNFEFNFEPIEFDLDDIDVNINEDQFDWNENNQSFDAEKEKDKMKNKSDKAAKEKKDKSKGLKKIN